MDGLNIDGSQLKKGISLKRMCLFASIVALKLLQLKLSRDCTVPCSPQVVFTTDHIELLEVLEKTVEGNTEKQKNQFPKDNLAWAGWIIARLGNWKGYKKTYFKNPPGVILCDEDFINSLRCLKCGSLQNINTLRLIMVMKYLCRECRYYNHGEK